MNAHKLSENLKTSFTTHSPTNGLVRDIEITEKNTCILAPANFLKMGNWRDGLRLILPSPKNQTEEGESFSVHSVSQEKRVVDTPEPRTQT